jgi:hypothetical protein
VNRYWQDYVYPSTNDKRKVLETQPHYTDDRFSREQTVFGRKPKGSYGHEHLHYDYSDRLWQWNYEKAKEASAAAQASGHPIRSCLYYEVYLSTYFGKQVEIEHIVAGVDQSTGYPYCAFGYRFLESD